MEDPEVLTKIVQHLLDQSIGDYSRVIYVSRLFHRVAKQYLEHEIVSPRKYREQRVCFPDITFTTKEKFTIHLSGPYRAKEVEFCFSTTGRFEWKSCKRPQSLNYICRSVLYSHELRRWFEPLRAKIAESANNFLRQTQAKTKADFEQQQRVTFVQRAKEAEKLAQAKAKQRARGMNKPKKSQEQLDLQRAREDFQHWKRMNKHRENQVDLFSTDFCLGPLFE
jgi:hypothetical protein